MSIIIEHYFDKKIDCPLSITKTILDTTPINILELGFHKRSICIVLYFDQKKIKMGE